MKHVGYLKYEKSTHKEGKLVSILAGGRHPDRARPVVVEVGELVGERLDVLRQQPGGVLHYVVGGGVDRALVHRLRDEEEVIPKQNVVNTKKTYKTEETSQARSHHCPLQFHLEGWRASHSSWS